MQQAASGAGPGPRWPRADPHVLMSHAAPCPSRHVTVRQPWRNLYLEDCWAGQAGPFKLRLVVLIYRFAGGNWGLNVKWGGPVGVRNEYHTNGDTKLKIIAIYNKFTINKF